jgi:exosortase
MAFANTNHQWAVRLFSLYLLWSRRSQMPSNAPRASWWGLPLLGLGLLMSFAGTVFYFDWFNAASLLLVLAGLAVLVGGWPALRWSWPAIAFLLFMVPLPYTLEVALAHPLQRLATWVSCYALQTLGFAAYAEANVIRLGEVRIGVVEAFSGLSMVLIFFALSTAVALLIQRSRLEKILIFVSAVPIALLSNTARLRIGVGTKEVR